MEKIVLFYEKRPEITISMELYFDENDQLIFDGYDIGDSVRYYWGDSDYEYMYTIEPQEVLKMYAILGIGAPDKLSLLFEIKKRFEGNEAYTKFGAFMHDNKIDFTEFTWA